MNFKSNRAPSRSGIARAAIISVAAAAFLSGCSALPSFSLPGWLGGSSSADRPKPAELQANPGLLAVRQAWTARIGEVNLPLAVQVVGNNVYVAASDGAVAAIDGATGREQWRASAGAPISAGVGSDGERTAVVTRANDLVTFAGGKELWRQKLPAQVFTAPFVAGGRVFVLAADRSVQAFDGQTGRRLWTQQRPGEPLVLRQAGVILAVGDTLLVGQSGRLAGLNPTNGSIRWESPVANARGTNEVERLVDLVGRVSRVGDSVCARAFQAGVGCVNAARGTLVWTKRANGSEGVHGDAERVFGAETDGKVIGWRRDNGDVAWTHDKLLWRNLTAPLALGRSVIVGDGFGYLHFLSREDGSLLNRVATDGSPIVAAPVVAGNTLVTVTRNGAIFGFAPQ